MAANVRKAPYKDFLQPALQRRFLSTALVALAVAYFEAVLLSPWNSLIWSWFPLGWAGFRAALIFVSGLSILVLRIAHYHVGLRMGSAGWQTVGALLTDPRAYETAFWYGVSSFIFCPVFLFSADDNLNLRFVSAARNDRPRINERPIFLAFYLGCCALVQTVNHYRLDLDRLVLQTGKAPQGQEDKEPESPQRTIKAVLSQLPSELMRCAERALVSLVIAWLLYFAIFRNMTWGWARMALQPFYDLPKSGILPSTWLIDIALGFRSVYAGTLLGLVWSSGNMAFSLFMAHAPLKNGQPLTFEAKDPNGSLLNGLKSAKLPVKTFAMWELAQIAEGSAPRRATIFQDIDRKEGPMWSQMYAICMKVIQDIESRVEDYGKPPPAPAAPTVEKPKPRSTGPLRDDPIFSGETRDKTLGDKAGSVASKIALSGGGQSPVSKYSPLAMKKWREAKGQLVGAMEGSTQKPGEVGHFTLKLLDFEPLGELFRRDFRTEFAGVVLGTPLAEPALAIHAIVALTRLTVNSIAEDEYGSVHRDIASILRTLSTVIRKTEALKARFPIHWTDTKAQRVCPEVDSVLDAARDGLQMVVAQFEPYAADLRLSLTDLRLAKEATIKPKAVEEERAAAPEPRQVEGAPAPRPRRLEQKEGRARAERGANRPSRQPEMEQVGEGRR